MRLQQDRTYIVAELSANHRQDKSIALESVRVAADCGVDAIKVQTYTADTLTINCDNPYFRIGGGTPWDGKTLYELYKEAYTPWEWHPELKRQAEECGIDFFSSPFDKSAVDFLANLGVEAYKLASFEITDHELLDYICSKGKPVLISTGAASFIDLFESVRICRARGVEPILLHCTSAYPTPPASMNLAMIAHLRTTFRVRIGLSDHSEGSAAAVAAVALGASVVEKHFILSKSLGGPDARFSMEPADFASMVKAIREVEQAIGTVDYELSADKLKARKFVRSLFVVEKVTAGQAFTTENVRCIRPGDGMHPANLSLVLGRKAARDIPRGTPLSWEMVR
jgi:pseudaminic acid synthase